ncbi:MAG: FixH family protein [Aureispira sp.]|nr:FixH family protein [Aureispira sp.]
MNWGYRIAIFFMAFISFMLFMLYQCVQQNFDLVSEDYYAQEVGFQEQINQQNNVYKLAQKPSWNIAEKYFELSFPNKFTEGSVHFFRPSDKGLDFGEALKIDANGQQLVALNKFKRGVYKIQLSWSDQKEAYYIEEQIFIP